MKIKVEGHAGPKGDEVPKRFFMGDRCIEVEKMADRWHGEHGSYFRILGNDEHLYILKGPMENGDWELVSFTHKDSRGTELGFEGRKELQ